jgi:hypothetical protein
VVEVCRGFVGNYCTHFQGRKVRAKKAGNSNFVAQNSKNITVSGKTENIKWIEDYQLLKKESAV